VSEEFEVIYDGTCRVCTASRSLIEPATSANLQWISSADLTDAELAARGLSRHEVEEQLWCTASDGTKFGGVDAVRELLATTKWWGRIAATFLSTRIGRLLATPVYRVIARYRPRRHSVTSGGAANSPG
jgi:predicted DCC family thiol-disulfide oxidoreductase YuxK